MSIADELRKNYVAEKEPIVFVSEQSTRDIIGCVIEEARRVSRTKRSVSGYFAYTLKDDITGRNRYCLNTDHYITKDEEYNDPTSKVVMSFFNIDDFGPYKDGIFKRFAERGRSPQSWDCFSQNTIDAALIEIRNGLISAGFSNVEVRTQKAENGWVEYRLRGKNAYERSHQVTNHYTEDKKFYIEYIKNGMVCEHISFPTYALYISISW